MPFIFSANSVNSDMKVYDIDSASFVETEFVPSLSSGYANKVLVSGDSRLALVPTLNNLHLYDLESKNRVGSIPKPSSESFRPYACVITPDGTGVIANTGSASTYGLRRYNTETLNEDVTVSYLALSMLSISADSTILAAYISTGSIKIIDPNTLTQTRSMSVFSVSSIAVSPDGAYVACGGTTGSYAYLRIKVTADGGDYTAPTVPYPVMSVDYSPDGRFLAVGTQSQGSIIVYDTNDWSSATLSGIDPSDVILGVSFSPDSLWLAGLVSTSGGTLIKLYSVA